MPFLPLFCSSWASDVDKSPEDSVSKEHSVFSASSNRGFLVQTHSLGSLAAAGRDLGAALHSSCKAPSTSEANHRLSRNFVSPLPLRPLRVFCGDWVIQGIWVKTLTLSVAKLGLCAWLYD